MIKFYSKALYKVHNPNTTFESKLITLKLRRKQWEALRAFLGFLFFFSWEPASSFEILIGLLVIKVETSYANWHLNNFMRRCWALIINAILTITNKIWCTKVTFRDGMKMWPTLPSLSELKFLHSNTLHSWLCDEANPQVTTFTLIITFTWMFASQVKLGTGTHT